ncbi:hypothetical protein JOC34_004124 [Virgibacillus halotolerans]|uniref:hypothetical protein n=1 Tax=Virgibacillus halotolerans TaxID=1071053 RepID=UPI001961303F|nr:hypothetical protein [Virgibacillus halotolerans]MBM7601696.1 hypothetical protein [Virgibacillus halotolerans]
MNILFPIYALLVLFIFNSLTYNFCMKMEMEILKQNKIFRVINAMILILLVCSYVKVLNAIT